MLQVATGCDRVACLDRLDDIMKRQPVRHETLGNDRDLDLSDEPAEGVDLGHAGNAPELRADDAVVDGAQLGQVHPAALHRVQVDLGDGAGERAQRRLRLRRKQLAGALESLVNESAGEVYVDSVLEDDRDSRERILADGAHLRDTGQAVHGDLHGKRDQALDLDRRKARRFHEYRDLDVGQIGQCLDAERAERPDATDDQREHRQQHGRAPPDHPCDEVVDHGAS